jgi:pimeloyl-ACP methyl ester carboxylesterase
MKTSTIYLLGGIVQFVLSSFGLATSFVIQPKNWEYKSHDIGFEVATTTTTTTTTPSSSRQLVSASLSTSNETNTFTGNVNNNNHLIDEDTTPLKIDGGEPILLLNGFGVGSFHQHRLIPRLLENQPKQQHRTIYCIDYLGQGRSWPKDCQDGLSQNEQGLQYSAET